MLLDNFNDNGINTDGKGFDDLMDNRDDSVESLAYEVWTILDATVIDGSDVGNTVFYNSYKDYMTVQGYDSDIIAQVWDIIENEYL